MYRSEMTLVVILMGAATLSLALFWGPLLWWVLF